MKILSRCTLHNNLQVLKNYSNHFIIAKVTEGGPFILKVKRTSVVHPLVLPPISTNNKIYIKTIRVILQLIKYYGNEGVLYSDGALAIYRWRSALNIMQSNQKCMQPIIMIKPNPNAIVKKFHFFQIMKSLRLHFLSVVFLVFSICLLEVG